ncbi:hypothetical protein HETIRDRAFT_153833, partial [Heterobasidion irregulare TC 32-1]
MPTAYELQRERNIAANKKLLESLNIPQVFAPKAQKTKARKRRAPTPEPTDDEPPSKVVRVTASADNVDAPSTGLRRSGRNAGKKIDYVAVQERGQPTPVSQRVGVDHDTEPSRPMGKRKYDPKTFGSIPGIEVGTWWETREACSADSIHAPWVAGISGSSAGAYSIALSGGYEDDVDLGYAFTFTGSGGRDLKGTKNAPKNLRTAPQSSDQSFENSFNKALKISSETHKPVRVIRGYKLKSPFAPIEGYRYDGLYVVEKAWMEKGLNPKGYMVCKFALKRLPGQPLLPRDEDKMNRS